MNLKVFEYMDLKDFEMQLADFQSSSIWMQKFIDLRAVLEKIERDRLIGIISKNS